MMSLFSLQTVSFDGTFDAWRKHARALAASGVVPEMIEWRTPRETLGSLFAGDATESVPASRASLSVPAAYVKLAKTVACHRDTSRWGFLYRVLFRLTHGEAHLLEVSVDDDVRTLTLMERAVRRDAHKMRAFVRFRKIEQGDAPPRFVAFHRPDHLVLPLVADFFVDRFHDMHWTILTPDASLHWNRERLGYGPGETAPVASDAMEEFWKTYYAHIFNPARVRVNAMMKEMPKRHWRTLPETETISSLLRTAPARVEHMLKLTADAARSAGDFLPDRSGRVFSLDQLRTAAASCRGCGICENATQTVFGEGPQNAQLMIVGEQPGDVEDQAGRPFVGPAGKVLMNMMERIGLNRSVIYVTNAVKHFKWEQRPNSKRRLHKKPSHTEVIACRPWLMAEIQAIKPQMILALGVTAAQSLLGPGYRLTPNRGRVITSSAHAPWLLPTIHPSFLLRIPDANQRAREAELFEIDLRATYAHWQSLPIR